jgi:hypothetical protein
MTSIRTVNIDLPLEDFENSVGLVCAGHFLYSINEWFSRFLLVSPAASLRSSSVDASISWAGLMAAFRAAAQFLQPAQRR